MIYLLKRNVSAADCGGICVADDPYEEYIRTEKPLWANQIYFVIRDDLYTLFHYWMKISQFCKNKLC